MLNLFRKAEKFYKVGIIIMDLALINFAYIFAFLIKFDWSLPDFNFTSYIQAMPFITIAALVYFDIFGLLKFYRKNLYDTLGPIISVVALLSITTVAITYFNQGFSFPRSVLIIAPILQFVLLALLNGLVFYIKKFFTDEHTAMVIGSEQEVESLIYKVNFTSNLNVKYIFEPKQMKAILKRTKDVNEVLICPGVEDELKMKIISHCLGSNKVVYVVPQLFEISLMNARIVQFEDVPAFMIDRLDLTVEQKFFKRMFDIVTSMIGLILALPIFIVVVPLIRLTSHGKALFIQTRVTKNNKVFKIYKLRTMYMDAEKETGPVISSEDDPRVTPVGRVLRKLRLDELPQLFNVLIGDMSIIGPRPERPHFVEQFSKDIPEYNYRNVVKAGITGYAQILGKYDTSPEDKLRYDLMYIKNYSLLLDIKLIFQTVKVLFLGKKMYQKNGSFSKAIKEKDKVLNF